MRFLFSLIILFYGTIAQAELTPEQRDFESCKPTLIEKAVGEGLTKDSVVDVINQLQYQSRVIELDRKQPEFVQTFPTYFSKRVNNWRVKKGRELVVKYRELLRSLTDKYGVPAHYIIAFWGLETNYGNYKGKMPVLDSLATLACDPRRSNYFTQEFVVALELMQRESLSAEVMVGSWAGAMGHTQFMPSAYKHYAIDGDNDGEINLWNSEEDALSSAAYFLANLGWTRGVRWGREIGLPSDFDYSLTGKANKKTVTEWQALGITQAAGQPLGESTISGHIVVPAGHQGPKFLVYNNFKTIMQWNNSEFYAIAVGQLADQINGLKPLIAPLPDLPNYPIQTIKSLQTYLNATGHDVGKPDGILGPMTRKGIRQAQQALNMVADGFPSEQLIELALSKS